MDAILIVIAIAAFILVAICSYNLGKSHVENIYLFKAEDFREEYYKEINKQNAEIVRLQKRIDYLKTFRYNEAIIDADFDEEEKGEKNDD